MQQTFPLPRPFMSPLLALNKYTGLPPPSGLGGASRLSPLTERHARKAGGGEETPPPPSPGGPGGATGHVTGVYRDDSDLSDC